MRWCPGLSSSISLFKALSKRQHIYLARTMFFSSFLQILLLFSALGQAADNANNNLEEIWNIDQSCNVHKDTIKKAYQDAVIMVQAAINDLETLAQDPPPRKAKLSEESQNFERAKRLVYFIFGIKLRVEEHKEAKYLASVTSIVTLQR